MFWGYEMETVNSVAMVDSDSNSRKRKRGTEEKNSTWEVAGLDMIPEPKLCPKAIVEYPSIRSRRHHRLVEDVRSHLLYLGWKIEYMSNKGAFRYISPDGNVYYSLRQVCQDLVPSIGDISVEISQDEQKKPSLASQEKNIASSSDDQEPDDCFQVSGSSSPTEAGYFPEAVVYWYEHGIEKNRKCHSDMKSKARKHLFALGWLCTPVSRNTGLKMLRYTSPSGKNCNSLRTACKVCMDEGGVSEAMISTKNSFAAESPIITRSRKGPRKDNSMQVGSHIEADSFSVKDNEEQDESKRCQTVTEIVKNKKDDGKRTQSTPVMQSSKTAKPQRQEPSSSIRSSVLNPRTVLSWLIDNKVVKEMAKVHCRGSEDYSSLKNGKIGRDGIKCDCCIRVFTLNGFEVHAGSKEKRPSANIILDDGRSLLECQRQVLCDNKARNSDRKEKDKCYSLQGDNQSDVICSVCRYGGDMILCDKCPSSFHHSCLGLKEVPEGEWVCPSCCCKICGNSKFEDAEYLTDDVFRICDQCEHKFHMGCIKKCRGVIKLKNYSQNKWFCSDNCENISSSLDELLGRSCPLGVDNLTWTILKSMEEDHQDPKDSSEMEALVENQSKLNVALGLMHECFEPVKEVLTGQDLIEDVIFNRRSKLNRLNFRGFYTVLLQKNEEVISVATIRVYDKVAELPLIATRLQYRKHGVCRLLMNETERQLTELGVERLILPAVPAMLETWTTKFGFSKMTDIERMQFLDYTFLDFQDTTMCHKLLVNTPSAKSGDGDH